MTLQPVDRQELPGASLIARYGSLVKLPHTVFALPFALVGVVYASVSVRVGVDDVILVLVAFTAARFAAMGFNRIVDRRIDGLNERTSGRELPAGRLTSLQAAIAVVVASLVFVLASALLNPLCFLLSPVALTWILSYSFTKRFTSWSHLWLGGALAIAPVGGYLATAGAWSTPWWTLPVIGCAVLTWVAGFDIFYALQDEDFDREHGLHSAVVLLGQRHSILLAKALHGMTLAGLVLFGLGAGLGLAYFLGVAAAAALLAWEHQLVHPDDLSRLDAAFFQMNGIISIVVFLATLGDRLL